MIYLVEKLQMLVKNRPPEWREGQAAFNYLHAVRPDLANEIRGGPLDPFHQSELLPNFWKFIRERV